MAGVEWNEISVARQENRHELILSGASISERISKTGLDEALFGLTGLNFLRISETCLEIVPEAVSNLQNLSTLVLHSNQLKSLTSSLGKLSKLKNLDVSRNFLEEFPEEVVELSALFSLNASFNKLSVFPNLQKNVWLTILDLSNNALDDFPDICCEKLSHLSEVRLSSNNIKEIPHDISLLPALKLLDVSENKLKEVPGELSDISKLKELNLKGNPLSDRRLAKMVLQCHSKQVLEYIRQHAKRDSAGCKNAASKGKKGQRKTNASESNASADPGDKVDQLCNTIEVLHLTDSTPVITLDKDVKNVRPHIVCCVVKSLKFSEDNFKKFIKMQNNLHDDLDLCNKRQAATLATHDLSAVAPGTLKYVAKPPDQVLMQPLGSTKNTKASVIFGQLKKHAQSVMHDKKRSKYSGIHKYLYLLEGKPLYPFLIDGEDRVISFPPLTNSNLTKMSVDSKEMLVEVTSSTSLATCKKVMDTFLIECVRLGIGQSTLAAEGTDPPPAPSTSHHLLVEQVKIIDDTTGVLQVVYPSRNDLIYEQAESVRITRNHVQ